MQMEINWFARTKSFKLIKSIGIIFIPIALYFIPLNWIKSQHTICLYKNISGHDCYGCGMTRAILNALHFNFDEAYNYNKLVIIVLPLLIFIWAKLVLKTGHN